MVALITAELLSRIGSAGNHSAVSEHHLAMIATILGVSRSEHNTAFSELHVVDRCLSFGVRFERVPRLFMRSAPNRRNVPAGAQQGFSKGKGYRAGGWAVAGEGCTAGDCA